MNQKVKIQRVTEPTAFITKNKQRVKQYGNIVYLNDGDEFEIELFNPLTQKILAKIKLNGNYLESGIVLRPGERVFLERYINEAKKFVFQTYRIDKNDPDAQRAIENNGDVEVEFFSEMINYPFILTNPYNTPIITTTRNDIFYTYTSGNNVNSGVQYIPVSNTIETGRIEKGDYSSQTLEYDFSSFNFFPTYKMHWKILPMSMKTYVKEEIVTYCTNCGAKRKKDSFKYCPYCGNKF